MQAQAERKNALEQMERAKRQKSLQSARFHAKEQSVRDLKKIVQSKDSHVAKLQKKVATLESR